MACWPSTSKRDGHSSGTPVARRIKQPTRMTGPDGPVACAATSFLFGLAPGGVCRAAAVAGSAVRSYRTVSPLPRLYATRRGGLFSVALSLRPARLAPANPRRTLSGTVRPWSPDFPPRPPFGIGAERPSGRLTRIGMGWRGRGVKQGRLILPCRGRAKTSAAQLSGSARITPKRPCAASDAGWVADAPSAASTGPPPGETSAQSFRARLRPGRPALGS